MGTESTDTPDVGSEVQALLDAWRSEQGGRTGSARSVTRFTVEHSTDVSDDAIAAAVRRQFGIDGSVGPLFPGNPALARFRLLELANVSRPDRADLFDVANALRGALGARTVEPDIGSRYFECECDSPRAGPESADWAAWCWADPEKDRPADANWALVKSKIREAWSLSRESGVAPQGEGVLVFQPDTGVVANHQELPAGIETNQRAGNFVEPGSPPVDPMTSRGNPGHGTGTASVVVSPEDGSMIGAAPRATLVPVRCIESVAVFDQSPVAQAIDHATRNGAHVITMSLGGVMSSALHAAVKEAVARNVIVIAAAGNCVGEVVWPARYAEVLAVGGINEASRPWRGSSSGPAVDVCAPAELVARADARHQSGASAVSAGQGTSFAAAMTAGIASLWLAHHGRDALVSLLPQGRTLQWLFRAMLLGTAHAPPEFDRQRYGRGIVDALALLQRDPRTCAGDPGAAPPDKADDERREALDLITRAFGAGGAESVGPVLDDPQHRQELACAALDRLRAQRTPRARVESLPPPLLSEGLRARLGAAATSLR